MGVKYAVIMVKISKKRILIGKIFHFGRCQIILWRNQMEPFDRAWLAVALADAFPPMIMKFPRAVQMTPRVAPLGLPKQKVVENRCELMHKTERMPAF